MKRKDTIKKSFYSLPKTAENDMEAESGLAQMRMAGAPLVCNPALCQK